MERKKNTHTLTHTQKHKQHHHQQQTEQKKEERKERKKETEKKQKQKQNKQKNKTKKHCHTKDHCHLLNNGVGGNDVLNLLGPGVSEAKAGGLEVKELAIFQLEPVHICLHLFFCR